MSSRVCSSSSVPPLDQPLPNLAEPPSGVVEHVHWTRDHHETHVTTLDNGIKVASEESFGQFSTVGGKELELLVYLKLVVYMHKRL